jgi:uncharacterized protein (TIGR02145 family)
MASKIIKQLNELLFILDHHGVKQTHIAKWIRINKAVSGFSQPVISRLRKDSASNEKVKELVSYLEEIIEILKKTNLYYDIDAFISNSQKALIHNFLFSSLENASNSNNLKKTSNLVLRIGFAAIVLSMGYLFIWLNIRAPISENQNCSTGNRKAIVVAKFQPKEVEPFSRSVIEELLLRLNNNVYNVKEASFIEYEDIPLESIYDIYFAQECDTSGLFLSGFRYKDEVDSSFICHIDLFNLWMKIPVLQDDTNITLINPPEIIFSIREDALFIADFLEGLLKTYEGLYQEALNLYEGLEKKKNQDFDKDRSSRIWGYISFFKGNCYVMRGENKQAENAYLTAVKLLPDLQKIVDKNTAILAKNKGTIELTNSLNSLNHDKTSIGSNSLNGIDSTFVAQKRALEKKEWIDDNTSSGNKEKISETSTLKSTNNLDSLEHHHYYFKHSLSLVKGIDSTFVAQKRALEEKEWIDDKASSGNKEKTSTIGNLLIAGKNWMAENLDTLFTFTLPSALLTEKISYYNGSLKNLDKYGALYSYESARTACPEGWRLPTKEDFDELIDHFGGPQEAYNALIEGGSSGFNAHLGGFYSYSPVGYSWLTDNGFYWAKALDDNYEKDYEFDRGSLYRLKKVVYRFDSSSRRVYHDEKTRPIKCSVRCIRDY